MTAIPPPGKQAQDQLTAQLVRRLSQAGFFACPEPPFDPARFHAFRDLVRAKFTVPETTITPLMARVLYALAAASQPRHIVGIGTYAGNGLVWLALPFLEAPPEAAATIVGCDLDPATTQLAKQNFAQLPGGSQVELVCADGYEWLQRSHTPIDLLFLDIDSPQDRKQGYRHLLDIALPRLKPGALVLAHDVAVAQFQADLEPFLALVKDRRHFQLSATLRIDPCGLEVSQR